MNPIIYPASLRRKKFRFKHLFSFLASACLLSSTGIAQNSATQVQLLGNSSTQTIDNNVATVVDPGLTLSSNGTLTDFTVSITDSYTSGDLLGYTGSLPVGITAGSFDATTRSIRFSGTATAAVWQEFLRRVTLRTTSAVCFPEQRKVNFTVGNKYYNPLNGHFYEFDALNRTWENSNIRANTSSYFGMRGYLVTITDAAENGFVWKIANTMAWMGSADEYNNINNAVGYTKYADQTASEGKWHWVSGPEKGTQFSTGNGVNTPGNYTNWLSGEPNNNGNEHFGHIFGGANVPGWGQSGKWNDFPNDISIWSISTLIEYGDMPGDNTNSTVTHTREIFVNNSPSGTITGGNVNVCSGTNSTSLTVSGFTGTVARWEYSPDNFLTPGTTVASTSTTLTVSNIAETRYYRAILNISGGSGCSGLATSSTPIEVVPVNGGNPVVANPAICAGGTADITLFGNKGAVQKWQVSTTPGFTSDVTDLDVTTTTLNHTPASAGTYYFRAQVQNEGCGGAVYSSIVPQTVNSGTPPIGGLVSSESHCGGLNSGTLTLSGSTGTVQKWQSSTDGGLVWTDIANTSSSYTYSGVNSSRIYRAVLANGSCGTSFSTPGTVTVLGGTTYTWLGSLNQVSGLADNWQCNNTPATGSDVIMSSTATNDLELAEDMVLGNIDFTGSSRKIVLGNHDLTVSSITGGSATNFIQTNGTGRLKILLPNGNTAIFHVGNSNYAPVTISNKTGSADEFAIRVLDEVYLNGTSGAVYSESRVRKTWLIDKANPNGGNGIDFNFNWNSGDVSGILDDPAMYHFENGNWGRQSGTTSHTATSFRFEGYTGSFPPFAVSNTSGTLPVVWNDFTVQKQDQNVLLKWSTSSEQNTDHFDVQRSSNGRHWETFAQVKAAGNSATQRNYHTTDAAPAPGLWQYRILQFDLDGKSTASPIRSIQFNTSIPSMKVYPNPVTTGTVYVECEKATSISILNAQGASILRKKLSAGTNRLYIGYLPKGMYYIAANGEAHSIILK